jgi:hypothetical protein
MNEFFKLEFTSMHRIFRFLFISLICFILGPALSAASIPCSIDPLLKVSESWKMTTDDFEKTFTENNNKLYVWLTLDRTRAKLTRKLYGNAEIDLTAFDGKVPVQEVTVDFAEGRLNLISVSIYNRADSGQITREVFTERFKSAGKMVGEILVAKPQQRKADAKSGLLTEGYSWNSRETGVALLEYNEGALGKADFEFLRLRIARPNAIGSLAASMTNTRGGAAAKLGDFPKNVKKEANGDVFISNLPMVDQGDKGYCVCASVQRVFEYYGIGADMHQIAQISDADPQRGTNTLLMAKELDKIDYRFKTRLDIIGMGRPFTQVEVKKGEYFVGQPIDERKFLKEIHSYVDSGLPLLWALELGKYPEVPQLNPQTAGGHMRIIIGYNDKTEEIIFSDSWGAQHESKRMKMSDSYKTTEGLFVLKPTVR